MSITNAQQKCDPLLIHHFPSFSTQYNIGKKVASDIGVHVFTCSFMNMLQRFGNTALPVVTGAAKPYDHQGPVNTTAMRILSGSTQFFKFNIFYARDFEEG